MRTNDSVTGIATRSHALAQAKSGATSAGVADRTTHIDMDRDGRIVAASPAVHDQLRTAGLPESGARYRDLFNTTQRDQKIPEALLRLASRHGLVHDIVTARDCGEAHVLRITLRASRNADGQLTGFTETAECLAETEAATDSAGSKPDPSPQRRTQAV